MTHSNKSKLISRKGAALNQAFIYYPDRQEAPISPHPPRAVMARDGMSHDRQHPDGDYCRQVFGAGTHLSLLHTYETATLRHL